MNSAAQELIDFSMIFNRSFGIGLYFPQRSIHNFKIKLLTAVCISLDREHTFFSLFSIVPLTMYGLFSIVAGYCVR